MLDIKFIRSNPDAVRESLRKRRSALQLDQFLAIDQKRRDLLLETEGLKARRNQASTEVSRMKKEGQTSEELMAELGAMSARIKELDDELKAIDQQTTDWLLSIPNVPHLSVPEGASDEDNLEIKVWGEKPGSARTSRAAAPPR